MIDITPMSKENVMRHKPTLIGVVGEFTFYEHPTLGDEMPLIVDCPGGFGLSDFWELPEAEDLEQW